MLRQIMTHLEHTQSTMMIGVISDTHGILSEETISALRDVDHIIHAGDVGSSEILARLMHLAPLTAVRGNTDNGPWAENLPTSDLIKLNRSLLLAIHNMDWLDLDLYHAGVQAVIYGHTHRPDIRTVAGVLYFNPGSASFRRNGGPLSIGKIRVTDSGLHPEIIYLKSDSETR